MRLEKPRVDPLSDDQLDPEIRERLGDGPALNIFRTLANHPKLLKRWLVFGSHILGKNSLEPRERGIEGLEFWVVVSGPLPPWRGTCS